MVQPRFVGMRAACSVVLFFTMMTISITFEAPLLESGTELNQNGSLEEIVSEMSVNSTVNLYNITLNFCPVYQCPNADPWLCKCDEECIAYGDCCWNVIDDSLSKLSDNARVKPKGQRCIGTALKDPFNNADLPRNSLTSGYFMVAECLPGIQDHSLVEKCQDTTDVLRHRLESWDEYADYVPVLDLATQTTYKNVHCARCNAVRYGRMRFWQIASSYDCDVNGSPNECDVIEFQAAYLQDVVNLRSCTIFEESSCPATAVDNLTRTLCESYQAPFLLNGTYYRNPHCALCNNEGFQAEANHCPELDLFPTLADKGKGNLPQLIPFRFFFGEEDNETVIFCAAGLTYNQSSEICELSQNATEITPNICLDEQLVTITLSVRLFNLTEIRSTLERLSNVNGFYFRSSPLVVSYPCNNQIKDGTIDAATPVNCTVAEVTTTVSVKEELSFDPSTFVDHLWDQGIRIVSLDVSADCTEYKAVPSSGYSFLDVFNTSNVTLYTFQLTHYAIIRPQNRVYSDVSVSAKFRDSSKELENVPFSVESTYNISIHIISQEDLLCPYTVLSKDEYYFAASDGALTSKFLDDEIPPEDYLILSDGQLRICSHWIREDTPWYTTFLLIIYVIFTTVSLIGLLLTFVNYYIFKELRNLPGMIAMNFVVALFFAQLVLIPSHISPENVILCTIISAVGHFLWLAAFLWMTILAYDVTRTFGMSPPTGQVASTKKQIVTYMLTGWLLPAAFVILCFVIQSLTKLKETFAYGEKGSCWLTPGLASFFLFGVPACICLCCNFVMFIITIHGIRKAKKHTKMAKGMSTVDIVKEELLLFFKISVLIGLSWIWVFLYAFFPQVVVFLFIHSLLNPLQGTFVFLVYVCNRRVFSMWKGKLKQSHARRDSSNATNDTARRTTETASTNLSDVGRNRLNDSEVVLLEERNN